MYYTKEWSQKNDMVSDIVSELLSLTVALTSHSEFFFCLPRQIRPIMHNSSSNLIAISGVPTIKPSPPWHYLWLFLFKWGFLCIGSQLEWSSGKVTFFSVVCGGDLLSFPPTVTGTAHENTSGSSVGVHRSISIAPMRQSMAQTKGLDLQRLLWCKPAFII